MLFVCMLFFAHFQYNRVFNRARDAEQVNNLVAVTQNDTNLLLANLILKQDAAIEIYLDRIKKRDDLVAATIIPTGAAEQEARLIVSCGKEVFEKQGYCFVKENRNRIFYALLRYG
ncbi:MAG TPA: hypothetical protein VJC18_06620, partial [bacterium]|nr:hypothetical protein [bacterium]